MAKETFVEAKTFFDDANYPHGFARSGDYNIREAAVLSTFGTRMTELANGAQPTTAVEKHFVAVVNDGAEAETFEEKTWLKYRKNVTEVKRVYVLADNISAAQQSAGDDQD